MPDSSIPSRCSSVRPRCALCQRPPGHCLCHLLPSIASHTQVLVVQHPDERKHALNTARLLVGGLLQAELLVAERLPASWCARLADPEWRTELLFPGQDVPVVQAPGEDLRPRRLVLLDGTWRKARKLLYLNPVLQGLPQVSLPAGLSSRYRLRKAPMAEGLSTIEAGMHALQVIEPQTDFSALLRPFDALIEGQIQAMGQAVYQRNHAGPRPR
ncbi:tRNA-uridine aminocarboxypropyltransferase [Pseudomonas sp. MYb185]|uniref:tRNA-uridine aminocarboxypropyltransferase n=1 Tax=Pseudomonas sp. MYb185 TaxID=1848729 RepID=UPI000CFCA074|nr:DTW domain-containing protein [Pseudomonas sp. MYb185]PRB80484.1 DTW domain-containing protein [Pseudomonas sp. MYb185]